MGHLREEKCLEKEFEALRGGKMPRGKFGALGKEKCLETVPIFLKLRAGESLYKEFAM